MSSAVHLLTQRVEIDPTEALTDFWRNVLSVVRCILKSIKSKDSPIIYSGLST